VEVQERAAVIAPAVALLVGAITLYVNGERAERRRRRELHARAMAAAIAYAEMPFAIGRRQHEPEHRSAERVRLTARFSEIQAEIAVCQALIESEGDANIAAAYRSSSTPLAVSPAGRRAKPGKTIPSNATRTSACPLSHASFSHSKSTESGSPRRYDTQPLTLAPAARCD
jgi:hypothetical protein